MSGRAVLFDMDGTLIDSEPSHFQAMAEVLRLHGHDVPAGLASMVTGMTGLACHALLQQLTGLALSYDDYVRTKYQIYLAMVPDLLMRSGATLVLEALRERAMPVAIVSNSDRMLVDASLRAVGLLHPGMISVSRNDVRNGKPDAEPYLRAAYLLGVEPADCIVVEDSAPGAVAGLAAGMTVISWPEPHRSDIAFPKGTLSAHPDDLLTTLQGYLAVPSATRQSPEGEAHVSR